MLPRPGTRRAAVFLALGALSLLPSAASACAVCFGKTADNGALLSGLIWGGAVLLGFTFLGIGGIVAMVVRIEKARARQEALFERQSRGADAEALVAEPSAA